VAADVTKGQIIYDVNRKRGILKCTVLAQIYIGKELQQSQEFGKAALLSKPTDSSSRTLHAESSSPL